VVDQSTCQLLNRDQQRAWVSALSFWQGDGTLTGVTTGSRFHLLGVNFIRSPDREPILNTPKVAALTPVAIENSDHPLTVVNLHALNFVKVDAYRNQLAAIQRSLSKAKGPLIVAGDFNTHMIERAFALRDFADALGLTIVELSNDKRRLKLDHIFQRGLKVHRAEVLNQVKSSDHLPLTLEASIPQWNR
jgi:endonuclease/exonuclease/phosphatase (EEP) superfamily protein YafD